MDKLTLTCQFGIQFGYEISGRNWNVIISIHPDKEEEFSIDSNALPTR